MTISLLRELSTTEISMVSGGFYNKDDDDVKPPKTREPFPSEGYPYGPIKPTKIPILTRPKIKISITIKKYPFDPKDQKTPTPQIGIEFAFPF